MKRVLYCLLFIAAAVIAYAETNLTNVYALYADTVLDFSEDGIAENIVDGKLVRYSMLDLKVGDVFIDTDGEAKKVAAIVRNGSDITIETVEPTIDEFFQYVRVPNQEVDLIEYQPDYRFERSVMASDGSIVTMTPMDDISQSFDPNQSRGPADGNMLGNLMKDTSWTNLSISVDLKDPVGLEKYKKFVDGETGPKKARKTGKVNLDIAFGSKTLTNKINPDFEYSKPTIKWKKVWRVRIPYPGYTTGHGTIKVDFDQEIGYAFKLTGQASISKEIPLWGAPNPAGAYAYLFARPGFSFNISALYQRYYRMTYNREMGVEFVSIIPISKVNKQEWDMSARGHFLEGAIDATGEIMFGVRAGVKVTGFTVLEGCVQGGPYVNVHVGATAASLTWSANYETIASRYNRNDFRDQRYEDYIDKWEKSRITENGPGLSYAMTFGLKYSANLTVLNFFNWTPFSGSWKVFEIGSNGTVLFGEKLGKK